MGHLKSLRAGRPQYTFTLEPDPEIPPIPLDLLHAHRLALGIGDWTLTHTAWSVKPYDLLHAVRSIMPSQSPRAFKVSKMMPTEQLVAVMMPFASAYTPVYEVLKEAAAEAGLSCVRVDEIWDDAAIINDIAGLIWRAEVVISDFSDKNANVFYETGIAHAWGREVLPITQSADDVPFDLKSLRFVAYLNNAEGRAGLKAEVLKRLNAIVSRRPS